MKKFLNFVSFSCLFAFLNLQATLAYATPASRSFFRDIRAIGCLGFLIGIISFSLLLIVMLLRQKSKKSEIQDIQTPSKISLALKGLFFISFLLYVIGSIPMALKTWEKLICPNGSFMGDDRKCYSCDINDEITVWHLKDSITDICPNRRFDSCKGTTFLPASENDTRDCFF